MNYIQRKALEIANDLKLPTIDHNYIEAQIKLIIKDTRHKCADNVTNHRFMKDDNSSSVQNICCKIVMNTNLD